MSLLERMAQRPICVHRIPVAPAVARSRQVLRPRRARQRSAAPPAPSRRPAGRHRRDGSRDLARCTATRGHGWSRMSSGPPAPAYVWETGCMPAVGHGGPPQGLGLARELSRGAGQRCRSAPRRLGALQVACAWSSTARVDWCTVAMVCTTVTASWRRICSVRAPANRRRRQKRRDERGPPGVRRPRDRVDPRTR